MFFCFIHCRMRVPHTRFFMKGPDDIFSEPLLGGEKPEADTVSLMGCKLSVWLGHLLGLILHAVDFVVVLWALVSVPPATGEFPLTRQATVWAPPGADGDQSMVGGYSVHPSHLDASPLRLNIIIPIFVLLACLDHLVVLLAHHMPWEYLHKLPITERGAQARLVEYSVSATLMTLAIAVESGITDVYTLLCIGVLMSTCMLCGLFAEMVSQVSLSMAWFAHGLGWLTCLTAYVPILSVFIDSVQQSTVKPPNFVFALVFGEFLIFCSFGLLQAWYLYKLGAPRKDPHLRANTEMTFIAFSFFAKTFLAWIVLGPVLQSTKL